MEEQKETTECFNSVEIGSVTNPSNSNEPTSNKEPFEMNLYFEDGKLVGIITTSPTNPLKKTRQVRF